MKLLQLLGWAKRFTALNHEKQRLEEQYGENYFVEMKKYRWWTNRIPTPVNVILTNTNLKTHYALIIPNDRQLISPIEKQEFYEDRTVGFQDFTNEDIEKFGIDFINELSEHDLDRRWLTDELSLKTAKSIISLEKQIDRNWIKLKY